MHNQSRLPLRATLGSGILRPFLTHRLENLRYNAVAYLHDVLVLLRLPQGYRSKADRFSWVHQTDSRTKPRLQLGLSALLR